MEGIAAVTGGLEHREDLISTAFMNGIKSEGLVVFPEALLHEEVQIVEHGAVFHVVAVDGHIVRGSQYIAFFPGVNSAVDVFLAVEVAVEIIILLLGLQHRIVNGGVRNLDPADQIVVQLPNGPVFRQNGREDRVFSRPGRLRRIGRIGRIVVTGTGNGIFHLGAAGLYHACQIIVKILLLLRINIIANQRKATEREGQGEKTDQHPIQNFLQPFFVHIHFLRGRCFLYDNEFCEKSKEFSVSRILKPEKK